MARKSLIEREAKRTKLFKKYEARRKKIKAALRLAWVEGDMETIVKLQIQLQRLPRNSAPTRRRRRCVLTGRPRGVEGKFGISRHRIREMMSEGQIPGLVKSSW